jgi:glycosyltransferase involved in cell wall biosynthesis
MTTLPRWGEIGDERHGVARYANQLATHLTAVTGADHTIAVDAIPGTGIERVHVHFTDRLWATSPERAAERFERLAATAAVSVTLHDIPQPSDGAVNQRRRSDCYLRVVAAAAGVVCNSQHEAALLAEFSDAVPEVIPLPVDMNGSPVRSHPLNGDVAIVGFFYPGKGHREAVDAVARLGRARTGVTALGTASAGHEPDLADLISHAQAQGVELVATGFLSDDSLARACRSAGVPLAAHQHVSASGSLATWISAGRKPLIPDTRYSREMLALRPGTATLYDPSLLADAIAAALDDPDSTWLSNDATTGPDSVDTARRYLAWWETLSW